MTRLDELESESIYIIREARKRFDSLAGLWSIGKDSTTLLWLCKKAFYGEMPFPIVHIDTGFKFKEIYEFRDRYALEWGLDLVISENKKANVTPEEDRFECCNARKTDALKQTLVKKGYDALLLGIRGDEHAIRDKERYFSPRDKDFRWYVSKPKENQDEGDAPVVSTQDTELAGWSLFATDFGPATQHVRVHPMLAWSELDVWKYIKREKMPVVDLYFAKDGKRFRSIGCETCCSPVESDADTIDKIIKELKTTKVAERSGRAQDKEGEYMMQKLRSLGYM